MMEHGDASRIFGMQDVIKEIIYMGVPVQRCFTEILLSFRLI